MHRMNRTATAMGVPGGTEDPADEVITSTGAFNSGGEQISVEIMRPAKSRRSPGIVVLHGAGGMDHGNRYVRQLASALAANGYATLLVHYFQRTLTTCASDSAIHANFYRWVATVNDAVTFAVNHTMIDSGRIAVFGYSLGGYLAVAEAAHDERIRAVIEFAGGVDTEFAKTVKRLPPTLVIHGRDDQRVPFSRASELEALLRKVMAPFETRYYPGEGHILAPLAALDALGHSMEFLRKHLA